MSDRLFLSIHHSHHLSLRHCFTAGSKPTCFTSPFHHRLSSCLRTDSTDQDLDRIFFANRVLLPHAVNCGRFCFWRRPSMVVFFRLCMKYSETAELICAKFTRKTCLAPRSDELEGQGHRSRSSWTKRHFSALSTACVRFMFAKTFVASSF